MIAFVTSALLWGAAIGCGLMAGVYFAFSTFVMTSLGRIAPQAGAAAMNAINVDIVRSPFMPLFLGTTLIVLALVVLALFDRDRQGAMAALAGGVLYVAGMFAVTMAVNVPLNDALAAADPATAQGAALWTRYVHDWTMWNHVRTVASAAACVLFIAGLAAR
ncbi:putative membrane protein [Burkholderia ambifaria]|nr:anthrone oxygenase family protein [Burkholderia ambifaria]MDR6498256.1 putative membrane protein [Burkholderia ambifaria]